MFQRQVALTNFEGKMCLETAVPGAAPRTPHTDCTVPLGRTNSGGASIGCASPEIRCQARNTAPIHAERGRVRVGAVRVGAVGLGGMRRDCLLEVFLAASAGRGPQAGALECRCRLEF